MVLSYIIYIYIFQVLKYYLGSQFLKINLCEKKQKNKTLKIFCIFYRQNIFDDLRTLREPNDYSSYFFFILLFFALFAISQNCFPALALRHCLFTYLLDLAPGGLTESPPFDPTTIGKFFLVRVLTYLNLRFPFSKTVLHSIKLFPIMTDIYIIQ